eukprot:g18006.t1
MVTRILTPVVRYGLMEHPVCNPADGGCLEEMLKVNVRTAEHQALARRMVAESASWGGETSVRAAALEGTGETRNRLAVRA